MGIYGNLFLFFVGGTYGGLFMVQIRPFCET